MGHDLKAGVAIVGGGWAGLAAGVTLALAGHPVSLHEASRQLGGRARTVDWNGVAIDNGQHLLAGAYSHTLALMARLGTLSHLERRRLELASPGFRLGLTGFPAPLHLAAGLLTARGLGFHDKLAAVRFMRALKRQDFKLAEDMPATALLAHHRQPAGLVEHLWTPICVAALNTPLAEASAQVFCNVLRDTLAGPREASDLLFNRADLGHLFPIAAHRCIEAHGGTVTLSSRVTEIVRQDGAFLLKGPETTAERVVLAAHPANVPALLAGLPELGTLAGRMREFTWQPILTLWLRFAEPIHLPYPMLALGSGEAPWVFERNDVGPGLAAVVASAEGPHLALPREQLKEHYLRLLGARLGELPRLLDWRTIVEKRATFSCVPDLWRPANVTAQPGLYLAGDYTAGDYPATLEGAVRSGVECARLIQENP